MKVAIQGEPGSNSHLATHSLLGTVELLPCVLSVQVLERLATTKEADAAVLPIENSLHGAVADHSDLLLEHGVVIVAELSLRIRHALIGKKGDAWHGLRRVFSHPVALSQCRRFFTAHPDLEAIPFYDTAGAVKHIIEGQLAGAAAIAAPYAAEVYGATILQRDLEDNPQNFTRFFLLSRPENAHLLRPTGQLVDKVSIAFDLSHKPGSLQRALAMMAVKGADLTRIESRPVPGRPWEYMFFVDMRVPSVETADEITKQLQQVCRFVRELGRYPCTEVHGAASGQQLPQFS